MSDEFGTVNQRRSGSRDLELLRKHYQQHRDTLRQLASEAPSEFLSGEYQRLIRDIDLSLKKVDELEGRKAGAAAAAPASAAAAAGPVTSADNQPTMKLNAGSRPLTPSPVSVNDRLAASSAPNPAARVALILIAGIVVLGMVGWLIWRATTDRGDEGRVAGSQTVTNTQPILETGTIEPVSSLDADSLKIVPPDVKFGTVRKGTRVVRQIEITNTSDQPISIALERSNCRCLFYEHADEIRPMAKENITVSLDGARARVGELRETIGVTAKGYPLVKTAFNVTANIR
jgi:hypothetical protein